MPQNPFFVQPAQIDVKPVMAGIGSIMERAREEKKRQQAQTAVSEAVKSGDPMKIADVAIQYPEYSQAASTAFGFTNKATEKISTDAYRRALSDPQNAAQYIQEGIQAVSDAGGRPDMMTRDLQMLQQNPEQAIQAMKVGYASVDPSGYKALYGTGKDAFKERELKIKEQALDLRKEEASMRRDEQSLKTESNELKRDELELKIEQRRESIETKKQDIQSAAKSQIRQQESLDKAIDDFMGNKAYVNAMTGYKGRVPAITTTGIEAQAYFDNIKNNLTLENLDKMTGVLSETDIKILSGAATALMPGMSKKAMTTEMNKIKDVLKDKSADVQKQLLGEAPIESGQALPQGVTEEDITETMKANNMTRQQVLDRLSGG